MASTSAAVLLVFSVALIAIGLVATARLRRSGRAQPAAESAEQPYVRARSAQPPAPAPMPGGAPAQSADYAEGWAGRSDTLYPGGMDADAAEIERLKAEIASLKAHGGEGSSLKRTQAVVAVAANISGILGLLVSVAALVK